MSGRQTEGHLRPTAALFQGRQRSPREGFQPEDDREDCVEPGVERTAGIEAGQTAKGVETRVLRGIGGVGVVSRQEPRMSDCAGLRAIDEVSKGVRVARSARPNRRVVVQLFLLS